MPVSDEERYAFKVRQRPSENTRLGLPTVMAFGVLADVDTGLPLLLSEMTLTTALRTAAASVMAARPGKARQSRHGDHRQRRAKREFQALAFAELLGINEFRLFDVDQAQLPN